MENIIELSKYAYFGKDTGVFCLTSEAKEIIYREKNVICSYSGSNEWCNHFMCELIDLFSGSSQYNCALGTTVHEKRIPELWRSNKDSVIEWIEKLTENDWSVAMLKVFDNVIDSLVEV